MIDNQMKSTLENTHQSIKGSWQLVMGLSLITITKTYSSLFMQNSIGVQQHCLMVLFIITFFRFCIGNCRYLDERYIEFIYALDFMKVDEDKMANFIQERTEKLSGKRRLFDWVSLTITGLVFIILGNCLSDASKFSQCYIALIVFNVFILSISVIWNTMIEINTETSQDKVDLTFAAKTFRYERYPVTWVINNSACLIVYFLSIKLVPEAYTFLSFLMIFLFNSLIDLILTWKMYFPKIDIKQQKMSPDGEAPR